LTRLHGSKTLVVHARSSFSFHHDIVCRANERILCRLLRSRGARGAPPTRLTLSIQTRAKEPDALLALYLDQGHCTGRRMRMERLPALASAILLAFVIAISATLAQEETAPANGAPTGGVAPAPAVTAVPEVTVLASHEVEGILGREVRSAADENMGHVVDVLVDRAGQVRAAIIDFGGFLGVGSRKIAVEWNALHFPPPGKPGARVTLELNRDQVNAAPAYQDGKPVVVLGALGKLEPLPE
jgi:PRC-barrel domain